jgi:GNAT superfamily N-acetyltransferase
MLAMTLPIPPIPRSLYTRPDAFCFPLNDGTPILLGPVIPDDADRIRVGLSRMSSISKYLRFFTATPTLTDEQLHYLTHVDQIDHVAWCATDPTTCTLDGLGLGRFVRLPGEPDTAEFAIAAIDSHQSRGLGAILLAMLCLQASQRHIRTLRGLVLPENGFLHNWMYALDARIRRTPDVYEVDLPIPTPDPDLRPTAAQQHILRTMCQLRTAMSHSTAEEPCKGSL